MSIKNAPAQMRAANIVSQNASAGNYTFFSFVPPFIYLLLRFSAWYTYNAHFFNFYNTNAANAVHNIATRIIITQQRVGLLSTRWNDIVFGQLCVAANFLRALLRLAAQNRSLIRIITTSSLIVRRIRQLHKKSESSHRYCTHV